MNAFGQVLFRRSEWRAAGLAAGLTVCAIVLGTSASPVLAAGDANQAPPVPLYSDHVSKSTTIAPGMMIITTKDSFETVVGWYRANLKDQLAEVAMGPTHRHYLTHNGAGVDVASEGSGSQAVTKISLFWKVGAAASAVAQNKPAAAPAQKAEGTDATPAPAELASVAPPAALAEVARRPIQELAAVTPAPDAEDVFPAPVKLARMAPPRRLVGLNHRPIKEPAVMALAPKAMNAFPEPAELASVAALPSLARLDRLPIQEPPVTATAPQVEDLFPEPVELASVAPLPSLRELERLSINQPAITLVLPVPKLEDDGAAPAPVELVSVTPPLSLAALGSLPIQGLAVMVPAPQVEDIFPAPVELASIAPMSLGRVDGKPIQEPAAIAPVSIVPPRPSEPPAAKKGSGEAGESQGAGYFRQGRYAEALVAWEEAAARGSTEAALALGMMYDSGQGVPQNYVDALSWYQVAAEQDDPVALFNVGVLYDTGYGVRQDTAEAASWYERAVVRGSGRAAYNLALLYQKGDGVAQDIAQAELYFKHAERLGVTPERRHRRGRRAAYDAEEVSFNTLHTILDDARPERPGAAVAQMEGWAEAGDPVSEYDFAYYLERGIGHEIDLRRAYALYRKAADHARDERLRRVAEAGAAEVKSHLVAAGRRRW